ncbi:MAG: DUF5753 domain-containing protein, partial [Pseudonocardiaceae bacterium]
TLPVLSSPAQATAPSAMASAVAPATDGMRPSSNNVVLMAQQYPALTLSSGPPTHHGEAGGHSRGAPAWDVERLSTLAGRADQRTWLAPWNDIIPDWHKTYVGLEGLASHEITYLPLVLHALVQTQEYSIGATAGSARVRPDQVERMVSLRMERQRRLFSDTDPLRLTAIIEESVLDRPIGGAATMREQLRHLVALSARDNVDILVLPTAVGRHDSVEGMFTVLHFAQAQSIGYIEYPDGAIYVQDQDQVAAYTRTAESLRSVALPPGESVQAITARLLTSE